MHPLRETVDGLRISPSNFPLYQSFFFFLLVFVGWYFTKDLDIDNVLKLVAWLFPLFAAGGSLVGWCAMKAIMSQFDFNVRSRRLEFRGLRFRGVAPIAFEDILAIQTCAGGMKTFSSEGTGKRKVQVYELNVAFKDGGEIKRINLLCHGGGSVIASQAQRIAQYLNVPHVFAGPKPEEQ
ncbi:MAG: hypothetical protein GXP25_16825 [Planctomycetes bacterium]|nr:hypothetical protein [Planctomycetota bacterium]